MRPMLLVLLAALPLACTPGEDISPDLAAPSEPLIWPAPPEAPKIRYLYGFRGPENLGIHPEFLGRVWGVIAGAENREMLKPYAVAVRGSRIAVTDPGLGVVHVFDREAETYQRISRADEESLRSPVGVAFGSGLTFVADSALGKVFVFDETAALVNTIDGIERPTGLAFDDGSARLYVADTLGHRIAVFDPAGSRLFSFGRRGSEAGTFNFPTHLALRGRKLYVNDTMNFRVQTFDLDGKPVASFGRHGDGSGDFAQPKGLGVGPEGHIYVADALFDRVQIFDADGRFLLAFGGTGDGPGHFWLPAGLFIDEDRVYVVDSYNRRVQVFQFVGDG